MPPAVTVPAGLAAARERVVRQFRKKLGESTDVTFAPDSRAVMLLRLSSKSGDREPNTVTVARAFLARFQRFLDPSIDPSEYQLSEDERGCAGKVVVFDRVVAGLRVVGSKMTMRFDRDGALREVVNGVASSPATVLPAVESAGASTPPAGAMSEAVLVPEADGLRTADMRVWHDPQGSSYHVVFSGASGQPAYTAGVEPSDRPGPAPQFLVDSRTGLPESVNYYAIGGVSVPSFAAEHNPAEIVYRFLGEHPALFHTGAPRCQFGVKSITRSPLLPMTSFVRVEQQYLGIPVSGAELIFDVSDDGRVMAVTGHVLPSIELDPTPRITKADAVGAAKAALLEILRHDSSQKQQRREIADATSVPELVVFPGTIASNSKLPDRLAYQLTIGPAGVYIDAEKGDLLFTYGTRAGQSVNDGLTLPEFARGLFIPLIRNGRPLGLPLNPDAAPAAFAITATRAFFTVLGWSGQNRLGDPYVINSNVRLSNGCPNAFFDIILTREAYLCPGVGPHSDVVAHELTHGVIAASSGLIYENESGALHEAYADLFGNLIFPDVTLPGAPPSWLIGEPSAGGGAALSVRNMNPPGTAAVGSTVFAPDPATFSGYRDRNAAGSGCSVVPWSCDFGFVHSNNGILNRAHVILSDGIPGMTLPGIGRARLAPLAFLVMTARLTPFALMRDAAVGTRDLVALLAGGGIFTPREVDHAATAFRMVELDPAMSTGWSEPAIGFTGTDVRFGSGETTDSGCMVTNVRAVLDTPLLGMNTIDLAPGTSFPAAIDLTVEGISFAPAPAAGTMPSPIGTRAKLHAISWFNIYGVKPHFRSDVIAPPPSGTTICGATAGRVPIERTSGTLTRSALFGGTTRDSIGNSSSSIAAGCVVNETLVELLDAAGSVVAGPSARATDTVVLFHAFGLPVRSTRSATIVALPGPRPPDLSALVDSTFGIGTFATFRLHYRMEQPVSGPTCNP
jgi:Zn-dependent metalloprotease